MTRLKLDWKGDKASRDEYMKTFRTMLLLEVVVWITFFYDYDDGYFAPANVTFALWMAIFGVWLVMKVRRVVRDDHNIAAVIRGEDLFYAYCCQWCTISQLARQTANYDCEKATFLSQDGLDEKDLNPSIEKN